MNSGNQQKGTTHVTATAIEVHGLRKSYGGKIVLDDVNLAARGHRHRAAQPERRR